MSIEDDSETEKRLNKNPPVSLESNESNIYNSRKQRVKSIRKKK